MAEKVKEFRDKHGRKNMFLVDVAEIDIIEGFNIRIDYGNLDELTELIANDPDKVPACVGHTENGRFIITDGHRRRMAAIEASKKYKKQILLWCITEPKGYTDADRVSDMLIYATGLNLTILEGAEGVRRLLEDYNIPESDIPKKIRRSAQYVHNCKLLLKAPEDIKEMIRQRIVSDTEVIRLFKEYPYEKVVEVIRATAERLAHKITPAPQLELDKSTNSGEVTFESLSPPAPRLLNGVKETEIIHLQEESTPHEEIPRMQSKSQRGTAILSKTDFDETMGKHNSISIFKKMLKKLTGHMIKDEMADEFAFIQKMIEGNVDENEMYQRYFSGPIPGDAGKFSETDVDERDDLLVDVARAVVAEQQCNSSLIQRKFKLGYNRTSRIVDQLVKLEIVGEYDADKKTREVKIKTDDELEQHLIKIISPEGAEVLKPVFSPQQENAV